MIYPAEASKLLALIPKELHDQPVLGGLTPVEAAGHVEQSGCIPCRHALWDLIPPEPEPEDRYTTDRRAGGVA